MKKMNMHYTLFVLTCITFTKNIVSASGVYNLTVLHTSENRGQVLPVHGWGTECALVPPAEGATCLGTANAQNCVLEYPFCMMINACRSCSGGFAAKVKYFEDTITSAPNTIRVDGGNMYFGSLWYTKFRGTGINSFLTDALFSDNANRTVEPMYDSMVPGNLDFVDGAQNFVDILQSNPNQRIISNYDWRRSAILAGCTLANSVPCFKDYDVITKGGRKIGILGMLSATLHGRSQAPKEAKVLDDGDFATTLNRRVYEITHAHPDCNIIVVVSGMLASENEVMAIKVPGIDVIVGYGSYGDVAYPTIVPNLVTGGNVYIVTAEAKGQTVGTLTLSFDAEGTIISHDPEKTKDYAPVVPYVDGVAQLDGLYDPYAWALTKIQAGSVETLKTQVIGQVVHALDSSRGDSVSYGCVEATVLTDASPSCATENPLVTWFDVPEGSLCCPYSEIDDRRCGATDCSPLINEAAGTWSFPKSQNDKIDACCPQHGSLSRFCCPMDSMFEIYGCRHSDCPVGNTVGDAMLRGCTDCDFSINVGGGYRATIGNGDTGASDVTYANILATLPYQNTLVTFKARASVIVEALKWGAAEYKPLAADGKLLLVSGLRYVWNPSKASFITAEACSNWDRVTNLCVGDWVDLLADRTRLFKVATSNFVSGGGVGYSMLTKDAPNIFEFTNVGVTLAELVQRLIADESPLDVPHTQEYIEENCAKYVHNYVEHFKEFPYCRILKAVVESPYSCPQQGMQQCLNAVDGIAPLPIKGLNFIQNGTCSECSGFGECNTDYYTCECQSSLIDGFAYPQQYRFDEAEEDLSAICQGTASSSNNYVGVKFTRGESCSEFRSEYVMPGGYQAIIVILGVVNVIVGVIASAFYELKKRHAIIRASQRICMHFVSLGSVTAGITCFIAVMTPSHFSCNAFPTLGALSFSLLMTPLCVKSQVVLALFNTKMKQVKISNFWNIASIIAIVMMEVILCVVLVVVAPYKPTIVTLKPEVSPWSYGVFCDSRDPKFGLSTTIIWTIPVVGINALLVIAELYYTLRTRNIPSIFNESKHMGFCVYNTLIVGSTAFPASFMFPHNPPLQTLLLIVSISLVMISSVSILLITKMIAVKNISDQTSVANILFGKSSARRKTGSIHPSEAGGATTKVESQAASSTAVVSMG